MLSSVDVIISRTLAVILSAKSEIPIDCFSADKKYAALLATSSTKISYWLNFLGLKRSKWNIVSAIPPKYPVKSADNTFQPSTSAEAVFTVLDWQSVSQMPSKTSSYSSHLWSRIYTCLHLEAPQWTRLSKSSHITAFGYDNS